MIGAGIWLFFYVIFISYAGDIHWGCSAELCGWTLFYFLFSYGAYFIGYRFYITKFFTSIGCAMAVWILIVLAGTVHWLVCIPAVLVGVPLGIFMIAKLWKD